MSQPESKYEVVFVQMDENKNNRIVDFAVLVSCYPECKLERVTRDTLIALKEHASCPYLICETQPLNISNQSDGKFIYYGKEPPIDDLNADILRHNPNWNGMLNDGLIEALQERCKELKLPDITSESVKYIPWLEIK